MALAVGTLVAAGVSTAAGAQAVKSSAIKAMTTNWIERGEWCRQDILMNLSIDVGCHKRQPHERVCGSES